MKVFAQGEITQIEEMKCQFQLTRRETAWNGKIGYRGRTICVKSPWKFIAMD